MLGIGSTELVLILFFGFLIFGPEKLPEMGRTVGRAIRQFRAASDEVNTKFKEEVYDPFQEAIDPYKSEIEETVAPIKEDIEAINSSFNDTKDALKDPLDLKGKKQEMRNRERELKESMGVAPGKNVEDKIKKDADFKAKKKAEKDAAAATSASDAKACAKATTSTKPSVDTNVDDPFADSQASDAKPSDELASLYDFDTEDGE